MNRVKPTCCNRTAFELADSAKLKSILDVAYRAAPWKQCIACQHETKLTASVSRLAARHLDCPTGGIHKARNQVEQGCFAATASADKRSELA
ncbi:hypothetical protein GCM10009715_41580 [Paeniglutamicibacter psychrophenolicus]